MTDTPQGRTGRRLDASDALSVHLLRALCTALIPFSTLASCDRDESRTAASTRRDVSDPYQSRSADVALDPIDVVRRAHELRRARRWFELVEHLDPEQREAVTHLIRATDSLLDANDHLQRIITQRHGLGAAADFDRSQSGNVIGVFSMDVRALDQHVEGDRAWVTIQIADRVPLERVELVRRHDRWVIRTDPPIEGVPEQIERLAGVLHDITGQIEHEDVSIEHAKQELESRQTPVLRALVHLTEAG